jgi:hypothetical protein
MLRGWLMLSLGERQPGAPGVASLHTSIEPLDMISSDYQFTPFPHFQTTS